MPIPPPKSRLQNTLNYIIAYVLFALLAILALLVTVRVHSCVYHLCILFGAPYTVAGGVSTIGAALLFMGYAVVIGVLEPYMNHAAKTGQMLRRGTLVFAIEGAIALLTVIILAL